jgi:hypothetical protein
MAKSLKKNIQFYKGGRMNNWDTTTWQNFAKNKTLCGTHIMSRTFSSTPKWVFDGGAQSNICANDVMVHSNMVIANRFA